jgi:hypothetical protein
MVSSRPDQAMIAAILPQNKIKTKGLGMMLSGRALV